MSKRSFWTLAVGASALLVAGGVFSSNMGFMLSYPLYSPWVDSHSGTNSIAFPYHPQQDVNRAFDVGIELPIAETVRRVLDGELTPAEAGRQ